MSNLSHIESSLLAKESAQGLNIGDVVNGWTMIADSNALNLKYDGYVFRKENLLTEEYEYQQVSRNPNNAGYYIESGLVPEDVFRDAVRFLNFVADSEDLIDVSKISQIGEKEGAWFAQSLALVTGVTATGFSTLGFFK